MEKVVVYGDLSVRVKVSDDGMMVSLRDSVDDEPVSSVPVQMLYSIRNDVSEMLRNNPPKPPMFSVIERFNGFELRHNESGITAWLGDGVDAMEDKHGNAVTPGTPGFCEAWAVEFNSDESQTIEAYFPALLPWKD